MGGDPHLGCRIRQRLGEMERSQAWLARQMGLHPATISHWMRGRRQVSTVELRTLAQVLGTTPAQLLRETSQV